MTQTLYNPFREVITEDKRDLDLIARSLEGDRDSLEALVLRHQAWIYNIAVRMIYDPFLAEDVTQEVLIKVITKLSTFDPERAAFRTWLYRIVANHIINAKKSKRESVMEDALRGESFDDFAARLPDRRSSFRFPSGTDPREIRIACVQCILLCLKRRERLVFILGVVFGVTDAVGSEICEVSRANFRKILSRSRAKVFSFFRDHCGLLNEANPCRCSDLVNPMLKSKLLDPADALMVQKSLIDVHDLVSSAIRNIETSYTEFVNLFRDQPFLESPDMIRWLRNRLNENDIGNILRIA